MMKKYFLSCFLFLTFLFTQAHPGVGIVKDSKGNIYYTDLKHVWKLNPGGKKEIMVKNVHTHELYMDANDNLYGEHLWYNGEQAKTWGHYLWCLKKAGELIKEIGPTEGFLDNYSFVRDSSGNMYWVERFTVTRFMKKSPDGKISKLAEGKFGFIGWIYATAGGTIYFTESNKLQKLTPDGKFSMLTENLGSKTTDFSVMGHNYTSYGIWTDAADNIYVTMIDAKKVNRISPDGKVQTIVQSNSLWTACSGLFDNEGNMWLLENSMTNEVRARKISKEELAGNSDPVKQSTRGTHLLITLLTGVAVVISFFLLNRVLNKRRSKLKLDLA
jgi:hypothetical protein